MAELLTVNEIIKKADISRATLYRYLEEGLPYVSVGTGKKMFVLEEVQDFIAKRKDSTISLVEGKEYSNREISECLRIGTVGGIRVSNSKKAIAVISDISDEKSELHDYWDEDILYYHGLEKTGEHDLITGASKALLESKKEGMKVYLFEKFVKDKYKYRGIVELAGDVIVENIYEDGKGRNVLKFPLKLKNKYNYLSEKELLEEHIFIERKVSNMAEQRLMMYAEYLNKPIARRPVISYRTNGDPYIREYAKLRANGHCELCGMKAPFEVNGTPFLEIDHIIPLSQDGRDSIDNVAALCPNCHRKKHYLKLSEDVETIRENVARNEIRLQGRMESNQNT